MEACALLGGAAGGMCGFTEGSRKGPDLLFFDIVLDIERRPSRTGAD